MKRILAILLFLCLILLTACNDIGRNENGISDDPMNVTSSELANNSASAADVEKWFNEHYVDESKLPVLDVDIENLFVSDDRTFILDDGIENEIELLVYEYYHNGASGSFADRKNKVAGEVMEINVTNEEKQFKEGIYLSKVTLEEVDLVDKDEIDEVRDHHKQRIVKVLTELEATEFAFVEVEETVKCNDKMLNAEPQFGDGEYTKYYLLGKQNDGYKIVEVDMAGTGGSWFSYD